MIDPLIRHQIYLNRYATGEVRKANRLINGMIRELRGSINAGIGTDFQISRMKALEKDLTAIIQATTGDIVTALEIEDLAETERVFATDTLNSLVDVKVSGTTLPKIMKAINNEPMVLVSGKAIRTLTPTQMAETFSSTAAQDVIHMVRAGVVSGTPTNVIIRDVAGLVNSRTKQQAEALVRTLILNASTRGRTEVYNANSDILEGEQWVAVLDSRTTIICAGRDGKIYKVGEPPYPPAHFNCRSVRVPIVKEKLRVMPEGDRASMGGPVPADTTYNSWLKRQPEAFQDDVLGKERADIFRSGKLTLDKFVDHNGGELTLKQLRNKI